MMSLDEIANLRTSAREQNAELNVVQAENRKLKKENARLAETRAQLAKAKAVLAVLKSRPEADLRRDLKAAKAEIESLETKLEERDVTIAGFRSELFEARGDRNRAVDELERLQSKAATWKAVAAAAKAGIETNDELRRLLEGDTGK